MNTTMMVVLAGIMIAAAVYAQLQIPRFTKGSGRIAITRAVLAAVGIGVGWISATTYADERGLSALAFLAGFGAVHVPAAFILLIKRGRGAGRS